MNQERIKLKNKRKSETKDPCDLCMTVKSYIFIQTTTKFAGITLHICQLGKNYIKINKCDKRSFACSFFFY